MDERLGLLLGRKPFIGDDTRVVLFARTSPPLGEWNRLEN